MSVTLGYDAIRVNRLRMPAGQHAGYTTGSGDVPWAAADWKADPSAVRICQDPGLTDVTADVADVEQGAGTLAAIPQWAKDAASHYQAGTRPGQRTPAVYASQGMLTAVANSLIAGGVRSGVGLIVANWSVTETTAAAAVEAASGPFPLVGFQFTDSAGYYDSDVWSTAWLRNVSGKPQPPAHTNPGWHTSAGGQSFRSACVYHGEHTQQVLAATAYEQQGVFDPVQAPYVSGGDWDATMPDGFRFWTGPVT